MAHLTNHGHVGASRHVDFSILRRLSVLAAIPRTKVDLYEICISYRSVGVMGLPREVIEEILNFLHKEIKTLKACSLTCRALFSAVRGLIHGKVRWKVYRPSRLVDRIALKVLQSRRSHEAHMRLLSMAGKRRLLGYAQELIIDIGPSFAPETLEVYLPHFLTFTQVQTLRIRSFNAKSFLPSFERCFAQFVPTLRSLHLPEVVGDIHEVLEFIWKFPHLDDLSLTLCSCRWVDIPPRLSEENSPSLKGKLILRGSGTTSTRFLLEVPGGLHFRCIDAGGMGKVDLDEILVACSPTLEEFSFRPRSLLDTVDLNRNSALVRFEVRVDPDDLTLVPLLLHEILLTISSPAFSEFTLKLEGLPKAHRFFYNLTIDVVWGEDWWLIDQDLDDMVNATGRDIKFVVHVGTNGGVWSPGLREYVGYMFPSMNARGLVRASHPSSTDLEGERFLW